MAQDIRQLLQQQGVRLTRQRQILLELIDGSGRHLDADSLYLLAKEKDPKINRVTVYRTLKLLKQGGLVDELDLMHFNGEQHYYETRSKQEHAHIVCPGVEESGGILRGASGAAAAAGGNQAGISDFDRSHGSWRLLFRMPDRAGA